MSRSTLKTSIDAAISANGSNGITGTILNTKLDEIIDEMLMAEDVMSENQNGSILLTNNGRGLWYGTDSAKTGNLTVDTTGAITGAVAWVIHNDSSEPNITGATKANFTYNASQNNYIKIVAQKVSGTIVPIATTPLAGDSASVLVGSGSPEGSKSATVGTIYLRTNGDQDTTIYEKVSGTGNTGWLSEADKNAFLQLTDGATITWNVRATDGTGRKKAYVTLAGNRTLAEPVNKKDGDELTLIIYQDATGGRTLTWPSKFTFKSTSEIRTDVSGYDILKAVYDSTTDKFYCWFPLPRGYREKMIFPSGSDIDLDMDALTSQQIKDYDGKLIYLNNSNSSGGGSLLELPLLSKLDYGYRLRIVMEQFPNGGELECRVSGTDALYLSGIGSSNLPSLDTSGTHTIKLPIKHVAIQEFELVVRDASGSGLKAWGILNARYHQREYYDLSQGTSLQIEKKTHGYKIKIVPTAAFSLLIPSGYDEGEEIEIIINQGGTGYFITPVSGWKVPAGNWPLGNANDDFKIKATYQGSDIWFADVWSENDYIDPT